MLTSWQRLLRDHEYDAATFGLTDEVLARRFGAYRERFGDLLA